MSFSRFSQLTQMVKEPFVVRNCQLFSPQNISETLERQRTLLSSYDPESELFIQQTVQAVSDEYQKETLTRNHYDTPVDFQEVLSREWREEAEARLGQHGKHGLTWIWTAPKSVTGFHQDPVYGQINGAWMWLVEGRKSWWFIDPDIKISVALSDLNKMSIEEAQIVIGDSVVKTDSYRDSVLKTDSYRDPVSKTDSYRDPVGKTDSCHDSPILHLEIGKNDLLWFPNGWIHRVETSDWSFGFGGYL